MANFKFLDKIAQVLLEDYSERLSSTVVVLPNKRAKIFLLDAIKGQVQQNVLSPKIVSIEEFVQDMAGIRAIDPIELLFEFYEVYLGLTPKETQQSFDSFANWAKTLLQDFNEIDRYLLDPMHVLSYLKDIEDIKRWGIEVAQKTKLLENYIDFWKLLPTYYDSLYRYLLKKGVGYQGLIYREAVQNIEHFSTATAQTAYLFAGFNALNAAEEKIIQHMVATADARIYWDADQTFLSDPYHDAGLFLRKYKERWQQYKSNPFQWVVDDFSKQKNIHVIGTPKAAGQAKLTGAIIESLIRTETSLNQVAVVLGEETLLSPLLHGLPAAVGALNITMGYGAKNSPVQVLVAKLIKMHANVASRNNQGYLFYYKDVLDLLTHPLIEPYVNAGALVGIIKRNNYTFITHKKLMELHAIPNALFGLLFEKWDQGALEALERITALLEQIKSNLSVESEAEKIAKAFVYAVFKVINKLTNYCLLHPHINDIRTLQAIYKQVIELAEVSFEGEPLNGLQIMGVLESRVLDFETVIVTAMNEGKFPAGKSVNSFIPYDVKRELGLPTYKEKDAIYTYHFYHLLQRAKNIYLIYNTESEGLDAGEKSRFITQLEVERQPNHQLTHQIYNPELPETAHVPMLIPKSALVMDRLKEIAEKGFSPTALTTYIRNPIDFYFQRILRIRETEEVEENIALNTLGTIMHGTLEALYKPLIGKVLTPEDIHTAIQRLDDEVLAQFKTVYKEGDIKKGRNLLAFEVAKRNVFNFLKSELESIIAGNEIIVLHLEKASETILKHPQLPFPVKIAGTVDRIETFNKKLRIIDYKSGKVERRNMVLQTWQGLTTEVKNDKIIQVLAYAAMLSDDIKEDGIQAGIVSFKNMKSGFLPFNFKSGKEDNFTIDKVTIADYTEQMVLLLNEIFDPAIPFTEKN
ncbi:MAG TPA: PD-(D/E)XK nuclease family protein [Flavobacterium sp.]|nr:PD-(D/E)XK nuclease family protein [Flavobacterium sp.]